MVLTVVPLMVIAGAINVRAATSRAGRNKKHLETAGKIVVDSTEHIRTVASLTAEDNFYEQYSSELAGPYKYDRVSLSIQSV